MDTRTQAEWSSLHTTRDSTLNAGLIVVALVVLVLSIVTTQLDAPERATQAAAIAAAGAAT